MPFWVDCISLRMLEWRDKARKDGDNALMVTTLTAK